MTARAAVRPSPTPPVERLRDRSAIERVEHAFELVRRYAGPTIPNGDHRGIGAAEKLRFQAASRISGSMLRS
jgi:hypothetical protein